MNKSQSLTPEKILKDYKSKRVDKEETIYLLKTLIEKDIDLSMRLRSIETLSVLNTENEETFNILEACLVSGEEQFIREKAAKVLYRLFPVRSLSVLGWAIQHDHSSLVLNALFKLSEEMNEPQLSQISSLRENKIKQLSEFYGVVPEEVLFYLELNALLDKAGLKLMRRKFQIPCTPEVQDCGYYFQYSHDPKTIYYVHNRRTRALCMHVLSKVPDSISNLKRLRHLSLFNLNSIPKELTSLRKLVGLELHVNNGKKLKLPDNITILKGLREVKVPRTFFTPISKSLIYLVKQNIAPKYVRMGVILEDAISLGLLDAYFGHKINLDFVNFYKDLKFEIDQEGHVNFIKLNNIDEYFLISLYSIPEPIFRFKFLEKLVITDNMIRSISPEIIKLKNLKVLDLSFNPIATVPNSLVKLKKLEKAYFYETKIKEIPDELKSLKTLQITYGDF